MYVWMDGWREGGREVGRYVGRYVYIYLYIFIYIYIYEPPSKSIVDAWYENIGYRFLGEPYRFTVFCSNQH